MLGIFSKPLNAGDICDSCVLQGDINIFVFINANCVAEEEVTYSRNISGPSWFK